MAFSLIKPKRSTDNILQEIKLVHSVFDSFYLDKDNGQYGLQLKFKNRLEPQEDHFQDIEQLPRSIKQALYAISFLFDCLKYHGLCENKPEYPLIESGEVFELYDETGKFCPLGHDYDEKFVVPAFTDSKPVLAENIVIYPIACQISFIIRPSNIDLHNFEQIFTECKLQKLETPLALDAQYTSSQTPHR